MTVYHPRAGSGSEVIATAKATPIWRGLFTRFAEWLLPPRG